MNSPEYFESTDFVTRGYHDSTMSEQEIGRDESDGTDILLPLAISLNLGKTFGSRREFDLRNKLREARESQRKMVEGVEVHECGPGGEGFRTTFSKTSYIRTCQKLMVLCTMYDSQRPNSFSLSEVPGKATHNRLKLVTYGLSRHHPVYSLCIQEGDNWYMSHKRLLHVNDQELGLFPGGTVAEAINGVGDGSLVPCLPCSTWPPASFSMVQRPRRSGWPSQEVVDRMVRKGCYVIPSDDDKDGDTVFMLSFAVPERELVRSLNQTQINIYGYWLTIIDQKLPSSLKSVLNETVVKHCLFWLVQDYPQDTWVEVNVIRCMSLVLKKLMDVTRNRSCPNFFVKRYDMFMNMTATDQSNLLNFLQTIDQTGYKYFLELEPFSQQEPQFRNIQHSFPQMCITDHEEERRLDFAFFQEVHHTYFEMHRLFEHAVKTSKPFNLDVFSAILLNLEKRSSPLLDDNIKRVLKAYLSLLMACHQCRYIPNVGDKRSADIVCIEDLLKEGTNADMSSAKLKMATLYLYLEKPNDSVEIISDLIAKANHVIDLDRRRHSSVWIENHENDRAYELSACDKGFSRAEKVSEFMALPLDITGDEHVIVPDVIQNELVVGGGRITCNCFLYSYLLLIICKHKLGEKIDQLVETFSTLVKESRDDSNVQYVYYNWLGYCLMLAKKFPEAQQCFEESLKIKDTDNAAVKLLEMLSNT